MIVRILAGVLLVVGLTGCTEASKRTVDVEDTKEASFMTAIVDLDHDFYDGFTTFEADRQKALVLGHAVCQSIDNGQPITRSYLILTNEGFPDEVAAHLVATAIAYLCPEHAEAVMEEIS
jgi:hypothetical protein